MPYAIVVVETSISPKPGEALRVRSILEKLQSIASTSPGGEVLAEAVYLLNVSHGAATLEALLRGATDADLKYKTAFLQDRPSFG